MTNKTAIELLITVIDYFVENNKDLTDDEVRQMDNLEAHFRRITQQHD